MTLNVILGTRQTIREKHDKAQITINLACSVTGTHKLEPWFIRKTVVPHYFDQLSINIHNFRIV